MRTNTNAYLTYKAEIGDIWNFVVMICYAVPSLNKTIKGVECAIPEYSLPKPDHFINDKSSMETLKKLAKPSYKKRLATYLWISSFSFFEAYVGEAVKELIAFHGGPDALLRATRDRVKRSTLDSQEQTREHRSKLHGPYKGNKRARYVKHIRKLEELHHRFPSELFSPFAVKSLMNKVKETKASEIPEILRDGFSFQLDEEAIQRFVSYKDKRNDIAHGKPSEYSITDVLDMNEDLKDIASKFDRYLVEYFFILESVP